MNKYLSILTDRERAIIHTIALHQLEVLVLITEPGETIELSDKLTVTHEEVGEVMGLLRLAYAKNGGKQ